MRIRALRFLLLTPIVLALGAPPAGASSTVLAGQTKESGKVRLTVDELLRAERISVAWRARCGLGSYRSGTAIEFRTHLLDPGRFAIRGRYRTRDSGYRSTIKIRMSGQEVERFDPNSSSDEEKWTGAFRARVIVRRRGRVVTRCRTDDPLRWVASAEPRFPEDNPSGSLQMESDPDDWVGGGEDYSYSAPPGMTGNGWRSEIHFQIGGWRVVFEAPQGEALESGRTYTGATRFPFNATEAGMTISGHGRGCGEVIGQFTIQSIAFDQWGDLTSVTVSFEQHCEGDQPALRGVLTYNRSY